MYYCFNCEQDFDEPKAISDFVGYYGSAKAYQDLYVCPYCRSDEDFEEMQKCMECNEYHTEKFMQPGTDLCIYCNEYIDDQEKEE